MRFDQTVNLTSQAQPKKKAKLTNQKRNDHDGEKKVQKKFLEANKVGMKNATKRGKAEAIGRRQNYNTK